MAIKVFFHICAIGHVLDIIQHIINAIHFSGLYDAIDAGIHCCLSGNAELCADVRKLLQESGQKFVIAVEAPGDTTYERLTLHYMRETITPSDKALYIHSKSVTRTGQEFQRMQAWTRMMMYHLIKRHRECLAYLDTNDAIGCNLHNCGGNSPYHFSGNFFWVRGDYFRSLPNAIGPNYNDPEFYVCQNHPRAVSMYDSNINHYEEDFPYIKYIDAGIKTARTVKL